ncbi:MAG: hypothetical protein AB1472_03825 [Candidatus Omnitrophota bacterium]
MFTKELLLDYQTKIDEVERLKQEYNEKKRQFEEENENLILTLNSLQAGLEMKKGEIKVLAEADFKRTGVKKLLGGIGIREGVNLIYDTDRAFVWAKEHSLCLQLDTKAFEKIAKETDIDFVSRETKITVTFPAKLELGEVNQTMKKEEIEEILESILSAFEEGRISRPEAEISIIELFKEIVEEVK